MKHVKVIHLHPSLQLIMFVCESRTAQCLDVPNNVLCFPLLDEGENLLSNKKLIFTQLMFDTFNCKNFIYVPSKTI